MLSPLLVRLIEAAERSGKDGEGRDISGVPTVLRDFGSLALWVLPVHGVFVSNNDEVVTIVDRVAKKHFGLGGARREFDQALSVVETFAQRDPIETGHNNVRAVSEEAYFYAGLAFGLMFADYQSLRERRSASGHPADGGTKLRSFASWPGEVGRCGVVASSRRSRSTADLMPPTVPAADTRAGDTRGPQPWLTRLRWAALTMESVLAALALARGWIPRHVTIGGIIFRIGQGVTAIPDEATAFTHRDAWYMFHPSTMWQQQADDERLSAATRAFCEEMRPFATGAAYLNFTPEDRGARRVGHREVPATRSPQRQIRSEQPVPTGPNITPSRATGEPTLA